MNAMNPADIKRTRGQNKLESQDLCSEFVEFSGA